MKVKGVLTVLALAAATAAFWPAAGSAGTFKGIVVAKQHGTMLVASPGGLVRTFAGRAALGSRVVVAGRGAAVVGHTSKATIRGIVVRRIGKTLILSSNRHLVAIHNRVSRRLADTTPTTPATTAAPGAIVTTQVTIANGDLEEDDEDEVGQAGVNSLQVQAVVKSVAAGSVVLDVQGQTLTVPLPAGLTLPASVVGQTVTISLSLNNQNDDNDDNDDDHGDDHSGHGHGGDGGGDD